MSRKNLGRKALTVVAVSAVAGGALVAGGVASAATASDIPVVTKVAFHAGNQAGGEWVSITGKNFLDDALLVKFGTVAADATPGVLTDANPLLLVVSDSRLLVKAPANAPGIYRVTVQNSQGISLDSKGDQYGYIAPPAGATTTAAAATPAELAVAPLVASAAGGTPIKITGSDLQHATRVTIDGVTAPIRSRSRAVGGKDVLTVIAPAHAPNGLNAGLEVAVTTPAGTVTSDEALQKFVYKPLLRSTSVKSGSAGSAVVLQGTGFSKLHATNPVFLDTVAITKFAVLSDTELVVEVPAGAPIVDTAWKLVVEAGTTDDEYTQTLKFKRTTA